MKRNILLFIFITFSLILPATETTVTKSNRIRILQGSEMNPEDFSFQQAEKETWMNITRGHLSQTKWLKIEFPKRKFKEPMLIIPSTNINYYVYTKTDRYINFDEANELMNLYSYHSNPSIFELKENVETIYLYVKHGFMFHKMIPEDIAIGESDDIRNYAIQLNTKKLLLDQIFYYQALSLFIIGLLSIILFFFVHEHPKAILFFGSMTFISGIMHIRVSPLMSFMHQFAMKDYIHITFFIFSIYLFFVLFVNELFKLKWKVFNLVFLITLSISLFCAAYFRVEFVFLRHIFLIYNGFLFYQIVYSLFRVVKIQKLSKYVLLAGFSVFFLVINFDWLLPLFRYHRFLSPMAVGMNAISIAMIVFLLQTLQEKQNELHQHRIQIVELEKKQLISNLKTLQQQIDPHFLFNSLSTLVSLIDQSKNAATGFVQQLSKVYRSVLQFQKKDVITIQEELDFVQSYCYLLEKRFHNNLQIRINIPEKIRSRLIIPASIQMLIENAVKHNIISSDEHLRISISHTEQWIIIKNNLNPKNIPEKSEKIGIQNLKERFAYYSDNALQVEKNKSDFIARLPIIDEVE